MVERESDCHTLWFHGFQALGTPATNRWRTEWESFLKVFENIYITESIYPVTGSHDLIAQVESETLEELSDLVMTRLRWVEGVIQTNTSIVQKL